MGWWPLGMSKTKGVKTRYKTTKLSIKRLGERVMAGPHV
jgi:hypothetical protein